MSTIVLDLENLFETVGTAIQKRLPLVRKSLKSTLQNLLRRNKIFMKLLYLRLTCSS